MSFIEAHAAVNCKQEERAIEQGHLLLVSHRGMLYRTHSFTSSHKCGRNFQSGYLASGVVFLFSCEVSLLQSLSQPLCCLLLSLLKGDPAKFRLKYFIVYYISNLNVKFLHSGIGLGIYLL